eukprot:s228_g14.t2
MSLSKSHGSAVQPLTAEEMALLRSLQNRALQSKAASMASNMPSMSHGHDFPSDHLLGDESASDWSEIDGGNMSDSSKRRLEADVAPMYHAGTHGGCVPKAMTPVPMTVFGNPSGVGSATTFGSTKKGTEIHLPPGVENLAMWGMTLIEFGKLASKNIQYEELALATDKDNVSYRKWCKSQVDAAEGRLKDLALYLWAYDHETGQIDQRPVIPGTSDEPGSWHRGLRAFGPWPDRYYRQIR